MQVALQVFSHVLSSCCGIKRVKAVFLTFPVNFTREDCKSLRRVLCEYRYLCSVRGPGGVVPIEAVEDGFYAVFLYGCYVVASQMVCEA